MIKFLSNWVGAIIRLVKSDICSVQILRDLYAMYVCHEIFMCHPVAFLF